MDFIGVEAVLRSTPQTPSVAPQMRHMRRDADVMSSAEMHSYLRRVALPDDSLTSPVDASLLRRIADAQLSRIPFENLDIHRKRPVEVSVVAIEEKLLRRERGGICYELNGLLARALRTVGFDAQLVGAAVVTPNGPGLPLGHVAIVVGFAGETWLVDVGFGGDAIVHQVDAGAVAGWDVRFPSGASYLTDATTRPLADFAAMAWWHSTSPLARFTSGIVCSLTEGSVRKTLSCRPDEQYQLAVTDGALRSARDLDGDEALAVLAAEFGIRLPELPRPARF
ncbi:arylamine N-acetyltransferase family protein [Rhodococcus globerulus]|uniref:arylamine N-acetyltransferase family protein n=1 Tax=Rhodococcus globerulus TaxID=33008 RepID=UPI001F4810B0|nr:arylamine N-acetyltransferase [Rhodococcus globerulus]MCE4265401.1 arylamine N-acetyltransferase [Rhodococcus globerulus]